MVVAIDGPAGSGKSTVAKQVAQRLGFIYIDTGAMYRAVGLLALRCGMNLEDAAGLERLARQAKLHFIHQDHGDRLLAGEEDVTALIRTPEVSRVSSIVSVVPGVRREMVAIQRRLGVENDVVMEGRDIGSVVFPSAQVKVFLDASPEERARRRFEEKHGSESLDT